MIETVRNCCINSGTGQPAITESPEIEVNTHKGIQYMKKLTSKLSEEMIHYSINVVESHWLAMWKKMKLGLYLAL